MLLQERVRAQLGVGCLHGGRSNALDKYRALGYGVALQTAALLDDARLDAGAFWRRVDTRLTDWHAHAQRL